VLFQRQRTGAGERVNKVAAIASARGVAEIVLAAEEDKREVNSLVVERPKPYPNSSDG
jgi:hypothetical protein